MDFVDPQAMVREMGLRPGMKVGDFGAGSGHYTLAAAKRVGSEGRVYALDVQEDVLKHIRARADEQNIHTIETIWGDFEKMYGTKLRDRVLDAAILSNVLFQLDNPHAAIGEIARTLKKGGILLVVDWTGSHGGLGPSADKVIPAQEAEALFTSLGFQKVKSFDAGSHHYAMIFTAP